MSSHLPRTWELDKLATYSLLLTSSSEKCFAVHAEKWKNQAYGSFSFAATLDTSMPAKAELGETLTYRKEGLS